MKTYIDEYLRTLSTGEQVAARDFIYGRTRNIQYGADTGALYSGNLSLLPRVTPMSIFSEYRYAALFSGASRNTQEIFDQANSAAAVRASVQDMVKNKLDNIQAALTQLDEDIRAWEEVYSTKPEATKTIYRKFGPNGLRPVLVNDGTLKILGMKVQANVTINENNGLVSTEVNDPINNPFFCEDEGLQVRLIYMLNPGVLDTIRLQPISAISDTKIYAGRLYDTNGTLVTTFVEDLTLDKVLEFSIPRTSAARIEIDLLDVTFNVNEYSSSHVEYVTTEHSKEVIIPGKTEKVLVGYKEGTSGTATSVHRPIDDLTIGQGPSRSYPTVTINPWERDLLVSMYKDSTFKMDPAGSLLNIASQGPTNPLYSSIDKVLTKATGTGIAGTTNLSKTLNDLLAIDKTTTRSWSSKPTPIYEYVETPEERYTETWTETEEIVVTDTWKKYYYETGLSNLTASSHFYTEITTWTEKICFDGGIPFKLTLTTDEFLPTGTYINLWFVGKDRDLVPLLPEEREWTSEILQFLNEGTAALMFYPNGEIYFFRNQEKILLPVTGKTVNGTEANAGAMNTISGDAFWAWYEGDHDKANYMPYTGRISTYYSDGGQLGELFQQVDSSMTLTLQETPYVDTARLGDETYAPVTIVIDGYRTVDTTSWDKTYEDLFPVSPLYEDHERVIHYKVRNKTIFFEDEVNRPVRVFYEYITQCGLLIIQMGVVHGSAQCPVLYSLTFSYV